MCDYSQFYHWGNVRGDDCFPLPLNYESEKAKVIEQSDNI